MTPSRLVLHRFTNAHAFIERARAWLLTREAENNLLIGLAERLRTGDHTYHAPILLLTVESDGEVVGCAFRTPPVKLGLTRLPMEAVPLVVELAAELYDDLPAVFGPAQEVRRFGELWSELRGVTAREGMAMQIYELREVIPLQGLAPGHLRAATSEDRALLVSWFEAFTLETNIENEASGLLVDRLTATEDLYVWSAGQARCMAATAGHTPNGSRVSYVYTPPEHRGSGYATACVSALSRRMLERGRSLCFLYTDAANPTSNAIYRRIGYGVVAEVMDVDFS